MTESDTATLQIKQVPANHAWAWTLRGFYLFKENPAMWVILFLIYLAIMVPLSFVPGVGSLLTTLLAPVFSAGLMWGCLAVSKNKDLEINHLFAGFKKNTGQLIGIGGMYMVSLLVIAIFVVLSLDKSTVDLLVKGQTLSPEQANGVLLPVLVALLFLMPVLMAYWFAPVLVGLHNMQVNEAVKLSFMACLRNMLAFLLYGLIFVVLLLIAFIPLGLGLFIVVPMMMTSLYASYVDIFNINEQATTTLS